MAGGPTAEWLEESPDALRRAVSLPSRPAFGEAMSFLDSSRPSVRHLGRRTAHVHEETADEQWTREQRKIVAKQERRKQLNDRLIRSFYPDRDEQRAEWAEVAALARELEAVRLEIGVSEERARAALEASRTPGGWEKLRVATGEPTVWRADARSGTADGPGAGAPSASRSATPPGERSAQAPAASPAPATSRRGSGLPPAAAGTALAPSPLPSHASAPAAVQAAVSNLLAIAAKERAQVEARRRTVAQERLEASRPDSNFFQLGSRDDRWRSPDRRVTRKAGVPRHLQLSHEPYPQSDAPAPGGPVRRRLGAASQALPRSNPLLGGVPRDGHSWAASPASEPRDPSVSRPRTAPPCQAWEAAGARARFASRTPRDQGAAMRAILGACGPEGAADGGRGRRPLAPPSRTPTARPASPASSSSVASERSPAARRVASSPFRPRPAPTPVYAVQEVD